MPVDWGLQQFQPRVQLDLSPLTNQLNFNRQEKRLQSLADLTLSQEEKKARKELKRDEIMANATGPNGEMNRQYIASEFGRNGLNDELNEITSIWDKQDSQKREQQKAQQEQQAQAFKLKTKQNKRWGELSGLLVNSDDPEGEYQNIVKTAREEKLPNSESLPEKYTSDLGRTFQHLYQTNTPPETIAKHLESKWKIDGRTRSEKFRSDYLPTLTTQIGELETDKNAYNKIAFGIAKSPYADTPEAKEFLNNIKGNSSNLGETIAKAMAMKGLEGQNRPMPANSAVELGGTEDAIASLRKLMVVIPAVGGTGVWTPITDPLNSLNPWNDRVQAKQQYIATIKQVIGKGLEGGVLRAEDEKKYAKIIPKMGDTETVFLQKSRQLEEALLNKRKYMLSGLGSAGFDVRGFKDLSIKQEPFADDPEKQKRWKMYKAEKKAEKIMGPQ